MIALLDRAALPTNLVSIPSQVRWHVLVIVFIDDGDSQHQQLSLSERAAGCLQ
jgi:hypothetical protein